MTTATGARGAAGGVLVLVGTRGAVEAAWRGRCAAASVGSEEIVAPDARGAAIDYLGRVARRALAAAPSATARDLAAHWRGTAMQGGEVDVSRLAVAVFERPPGQAAAAVQAAFGAGDDDAVRALRAARALDPRPPGVLLIAPDVDAAIRLVWLAEQLGDGDVAVAATPDDWAAVAARSPRAVARCTVLPCTGAGDATVGPRTVDPAIADLAELRERARTALAEAAVDPALEGAALSAAEAFLAAVLERRPTTAGRFVLDGRPGFAFGNGPCRVDLLASVDRIALEIDGPFHFADHDAYRRDRRKDLLLQQHDFAVIRVLALDVVDRLETILETVDATLAWKGHR